MNQKYRHNWTIRDFTKLFNVCREYEGDENRVNELLKRFENNRANGLRMMIEKYEFLNGDQEIRPWFKNTISKKMLKAWEEYKQSNNTVSNNVVDLGPLPQMIRTSYDNYEDISLICDNDLLDLNLLHEMICAPSYNNYEAEELICDDSFSNFQNNNRNEFVMPIPCEKCYTFICNNLCFEEEIELPPSQVLTRMFTNAHLPDDEPDDPDKQVDVYSR
jgi:hypothetical protein